MGLSLNPQKSLLVIPCRRRSVVLAALSFGLFAFSLLSTDFSRKIVPNPLARVNWIPQRTLNSSLTDQFYVFFFRRDPSSALHYSPPAQVPARPAADGNFSVSNSPGQSCSNLNPSHREGSGALAASFDEKDCERSEKGYRKENVSSASPEALYGNSVDAHEEEVYRAPAQNVENGTLPGDAVFNASSAPGELVRGNGSNTTSSSSFREEISSLAPLPSNLLPPSTAKHLMDHCDFSIGRWVEDNSPPLYQPGSCQFIDQGFSCQQNGRPDSNYMRWKWVPRGCDVPRLNGKRMLERLRGKRLLFVGDSLNRNQWESLICILRESLADKTRVREIHGGRTFKLPGAYSFKFQDYNCTLEFYTAPFLVEQEEKESSRNFTVWLDRMEKSEREWKNADVLVFNTGHWWTEDKISGWDTFREGAIVHHKLDVMAAYRKAIQTWATWIDTYINAASTRVFFRGYSPSHYSGGQWNSGGQCHSETQPIYNESFINPYPSKMQVVEEIISQMRVPVHILNITRLSDFRKDAHPAVYGHRPQDIKEYQDCSHWCLPGLPDTWNELLSFALWTDD